jgi:hypothetical protein
MRIFVSYSFRTENSWVEDFILPLIGCFGHVPVTGRILQGQPIPEEVKSLIRRSNRVLCFTTRASPIYGPAGEITGHTPPGWVRDELMMARGANRDAIEFRETGVIYDGAAPFSAWHEFDRDRLPELLLRLAELLKDWPVGPLMLRLRVPSQLAEEFDANVQAQMLAATCTARDANGDVLMSEIVHVLKSEDRYLVPFWIKPDPNVSIEIEISHGAHRLVCRGVSPTIFNADLRQL